MSNGIELESEEVELIIKALRSLVPIYGNLPSKKSVINKLTQYTEFKLSNRKIEVNMFYGYQRKHIFTDLREYVIGENLDSIGVSDSAKAGDMIARNPADHSDQWLITEEYFKENFIDMAY